jgi:hypothetical protein
MPYNPELEQTIKIGKPYKEAAKRLAKRQKRYLQGTIEMLIQEACDKEHIRI